MNACQTHTCSHQHHPSSVITKNRKANLRNDSIMHDDLTTCIVGGGNSAHVLIPLLTEAGHNVTLLTRRPGDWKDDVECEVQDGRTGVTLDVHMGRLTAKSTDPAKVIPQADIIILCMPVHAYRPALVHLAPFVNRDKSHVFIGTIFGQAGFNWMVHAEVEKAQNLTNVVTFAIGNIPWICRTAEYGRKGINYGPKTINTVAVSPRDQFETLNTILLGDLSYRPFGRGRFELAEFMDLTMSCDNQIIHPARCYGLWKRYGGQWKSKDSVPLFYRDFDEMSADILTKLEDEYTSIRSALKARFPERTFKYMLSYLELEALNHHQQDAAVDVLSSLRDSIQLSSIQTPVVPVANDSDESDDDQDEKKHEDKENLWKGWEGAKKCFYELDTTGRFFTDDIPYGLLIAKWLAQELGVNETPMIDQVIMWAQRLRGEHFLDGDGKIDTDYCLAEKYRCGIPLSYGITDLEDMLD
jgi:opine dehydrogenase